MNARTLALIVLIVASSQGGAECTACHASVADGLAGSPHGVLASDNAASAGCVGCHGDASAHMANPMAGGVLSFDEEPLLEKDAACGGCHRDTHAAPKSAHATAGIACSDCHSVHTASESQWRPLGFEKLATGSAACVGCHEDVFARFAFTKRHRLQDNAVTCQSCHNPHDPPQRLQLGAVKQERCASCHANVSGPFIFEHGASRVDGCLSCHAPHGSPNRFLLTHQKVGEQCYSCHGEVVQFHLGFSPFGTPRFGVDSNCTNCHSTIHGSNLDPAFLK